jgi:hypothetical protein
MVFSSALYVVQAICRRQRPAAAACRSAHNNPTFFVEGFACVVVDEFPSLRSNAILRQNRLKKNQKKTVPLEKT